MHSSRIAELLRPFLTPARPPRHSEPARSAGEKPAVITPSQLQSISIYIDILLRWNARINLTAIRDSEHIVTRHFGESLFAARHLFPDSDSTVSAPSALEGFDQAAGLTLADIGSGAGFPGLPVKLWAPHIHLTLIESNHKKAAFLREVVRALTLTNVDVRNTRAEDLIASQPPHASPTHQPEGLHDTSLRHFDVVTLRAVEHSAIALPLAARLLAPTGRLALLIGSSQIRQAQSILPDFSWDAPIPIPLSAARLLLIGRSPNRRASSQAEPK